MTTILLESKLLKADKSILNYDEARNLAIETSSLRTDTRNVCRNVKEMWRRGEIQESTYLGFLNGWKW